MPPCGTIAVPVSLASRRIADTSPVDPGRRIAAAASGEKPALFAEIGRHLVRAADGMVGADDRRKTVEKRGGGGVHRPGSVGPPAATVEAPGGSALKR